MNDVKDVSNYIIKYYNQKNIEITHMKLQKLLYFVQVIFLLELNKKCFENKMLACHFGPIVEEIFDKYTGIGRTPLYFNGIIKHLERDDLIDNICERFLNYSNNRLGDIITKQNPWIKAFDKGYMSEITPESIINYFEIQESIINNFKI